MFLNNYVLYIHLGNIYIDNIYIICILTIYGGDTIKVVLPNSKTGA